MSWREKVRDIASKAVNEAIAIAMELKGIDAPGPKPTFQSVAVLLFDISKELESLAAETEMVEGNPEGSCGDYYFVDVYNEGEGLRCIAYWSGEDSTCTPTRPGEWWENCNGVSFEHRVIRRSASPIEMPESVDPIEFESEG